MSTPRDWPPEIPSTPPAWCEQEWCDGGWTCRHPACLDAVDASGEDMAYDAAREAS